MKERSEPNRNLLKCRSRIAIKLIHIKLTPSTVAAVATTQHSQNIMNIQNFERMEQKIYYELMHIGYEW